MRGFSIGQPKGFSAKRPLVDIPTIGVDYKLATLLKAKPHFPLVILDLKEVYIIKNQEGAYNVDALKVAQKKEEAAPAKPEKKSAALSMKIDTLKLNLGKVTVQEYTKEGQAYLRTHDVHVKDKTYTNISSAQQLVTLVLVESMKPAAIKGAGIYGAASLAGVALLPAGIAVAVLGSQDFASDTFYVRPEKAHEASLNVIKAMGELTAEDKKNNTMKAKIDGADVAVEIKQKASREVEIIVSARKVLLPQPVIAGEVLYKIMEAL